MLSFPKTLQNVQTKKYLDTYRAYVIYFDGMTKNLLPNVGIEKKKTKNKKNNDGFKKICIFVTISRSGFTWRDLVKTRRQSKALPGESATLCLLPWTRVLPRQPWARLIPSSSSFRSSISFFYPLRLPPSPLSPPTRSLSPCDLWLLVFGQGGSGLSALGAGEIPPRPLSLSLSAKRITRPFNGAAVFGPLVVATAATRARRPSLM